jgi:hypothetical protein
MLSMESALFVAASGTACLATNVVFHLLSSAIGADVQREMQSPAGPFRPLQSAPMLYPLIGAPYVSALLLLAAKSALRVPARDGVRLALVLWGAGAAHGILIDWCTYKVSKRVAVYFAAATLACAAVNGSLLARMVQ